MQCDTPGLGGLCWGVQVCFGVKYWGREAAGPRCPKAASGLSGCPIWCCLQWLLSSSPAYVCSRYCFQSLSNFYKSSFEHLHLMKQSQRKHSKQGFQFHLGTSRQAKVPAWTSESIVVFSIPHHFFEAVPRVQWGWGTSSAWLQGENPWDQCRATPSLCTGPCLWPEGAHRELVCPGALLLSRVLEKALLPPSRHQDVQHNSRFLNMCCLAPKQRDFCSL